MQKLIDSLQILGCFACAMMVPVAPFIIVDILEKV